MESDHFALVENPFFEWELSRLGGVAELDEILMPVMWAIARMADSFPFAPESKSIRVATWKPVLTIQGDLIRLLVYFTILDLETVELISIKSEPC
ncbi:MAG: hypothetical protein KDN19_09530 [Verrucomicrobiae bacterium]|nr:hypothetical protein [Verrucomicrobiae bacterium]